MRVTVLSSLPPQRGVTPYTLRLLGALAARDDLEVEALGFRVLYPRRLYPGGTPDAANGVEVAALPVPANRRLTWNNPLTWLRAGLGVRGDVVHAQWWSWFLAPAYVVVLALARLRGKCIVVTVHNTDPHEGGLVQRLANGLVLPIAHRIIVHTERNRRSLIERGAQQDRVFVVPMGVAPRCGIARTSRREARTALGLPPSAPLVLFFGNIRPYKGVDDLIDAFRILLQRLPEARLAIVGQPWRGAKPVAEAIERAGIGQATIARLAYVETREMQLFMDAADVVVFPYRRFDAQSAAAADALAAGRAMIVTDVGGLRDLVRDPRVVVPPGDPRALADALCDVLRDDAWRSRLETDAGLVRRELSWDGVAAATVRVYRAGVARSDECIDNGAGALRRWRRGGGVTASNVVVLDEYGDVEHPRDVQTAGHDRVGRNVLFNFSGQIWLVGLAFVSTPAILRLLGTDAFGLWITVNVTAAYFTILDLGFTRATVKFISDCYAKGDAAGLEDVVRSSTLLFLAFGAVGALAVAAGGYVLSHDVLDLPIALRATAEWAFYLAAISFFINMASTPVTAIPMALQRFEFVTARIVVTSTATTVGAIVLLQLGFGLVAMLACSAIVNLVAALIFAGLVRRMLPEVRFSPRLHWPMLRRLATFSGYKFVSNLSDQVVFQMDRLLVGMFLPIAAVAYYAMPALIIQRMLPMVGHVTNAAFPAMSGNAALGRADHGRALYVRMTRLVTICVLPVCVATGLLARPLLGVWAGEDVATHSALTLQVLAAAAFVAALAGPAATANEAVGRPWVTTVFAVVSAVLNLVLNLVLINTLGYAGAAWAFLINAAVQVPVFVWVTNRSLGVSHRAWFVESVARPGAAAGLAATVPLLVLLYTSGVMTLALGGCGFIVMYLAAAWVVVATRQERGSLIGLGKEVVQTCRKLPRSEFRTTMRRTLNATVGAGREG